MNPSQSLLSLMPLQAQKQVLLLIKLHGDEKKLRQSYQSKCSQYEQQIIELKKQIEKIRKQNQQLKQKWKNSFNMISKVRQNFSNQKVKCIGNNNVNINVKSTSDSLLKYKRKLKFNKDQEEWTEQSEDDQNNNNNNNNNQQNIINKSNNNKINNNNNLLQQQQTFLPPMSNKKQRKPIVQSQPQSQSQFQLQPQPQSQFQSTPRNNSKNIGHNPSHPNESMNINKSFSNSKKAQIEYLKQQIQQLTVEIKNKQTCNLTLSQKAKKCQQIKNRYKLAKSRKNSQDNQNQSIHININNSMNHMNSMMIQHSSNLETNYHNNNNNIVELQKHNSSFKTKLNFDTNYNHNHNNNNNSNNTNSNNNNNNNINTQQSQSFISQPSTNPIKQTLISQQNIKQNMSSNNKSIYKPIKTSQSQTIQTKKPNKSQLQQSFYDDGLLDLIAQMNP